MTRAKCYARLVCGGGIVIEYVDAAREFGDMINPDLVYEILKQKIINV